MTKRCSRCLLEKPVDDFHRHPTAALGRKNHCKGCCRVIGHELYSRRLAATGKTRRVVLGGTKQFSHWRQGDVRDDGMVFHSKRRVPGGFREWWMPREEFEARRARSRELARVRFQTDVAYREKEREENTSEGRRASKRRWNKRNRAYLSDYFAMRRAKERGAYRALSDEEKSRVRMWYRFRDTLNRVHGRAVFHVDHIVAIARGGLHHPDNLRVTTAAFNVRKFVNAAPT